MEILVAQLINGLRIGLIYAIVATGYNLLALVTGVMHWSHSHLMVLAMYSAWLTLKLSQGNIVLSLCSAILAGTLISAMIGPIFVPFIKKRAPLEAFVASLGISIIVVEIMSQWLNNGNPIVFPDVLSGQKPALKVGVTIISYGDLLILLGSVAIVIAFFYFLNRTKRGRMLRAVAQDSYIATILGISTVKMSLFSFAIIGFTGGVTAIFLAATIGSASSTLGDMLAFKCLSILLFASVGNLKGGLICALILGITESLTVGYLAGQWANAISLSMILVILLFKPEGMFGPQY